MQLRTPSFLFFLGLFFIIYLIKVSVLIEPYVVSRFSFWSILVLFALLFILRKQEELTFHPLDGLVLLFYGLNILSIAWSRNFGEAIFTGQHYLLFFITYYILRHILFQKKNNTSLLAKIFILNTVLVIFISAYQIIEVFRSDGLEGENIYKVIGNSGHKNLLSSYLFLLFGINLYFLPAHKQKVWIYILLGLQIVLIILLRSRAVYMAFFLFSIVLGLHYLLSKHYSKKHKLKILGIGGLLFLVGLIPLRNFIIKNKINAFNPASYLESNTGSERLFVWYKTVGVLQERPLLGWGSGQWKLEFPSKNVSGAYRLQEQNVVFTRAHNDFLEIFTEVGIIGFLLYVSIFVFAIWLLFKNNKNSSNKQLIVVAATLLGYMLIAFFSFPKERPEHQILLAFLLAVTVVNSKQDFKFFKEISFSKVQKQVFLISISSFLLINIPIGYYRFLANKYSKDLVTSMQAGDSMLILEQAKNAHSFWCDLDVKAVPFKWYEGVGHYLENKYSLAEAAFAEAYQLNPYNFNVLNNYGSTLVQLKKQEEAIEIYLKAIEINPKYEEGIFNLCVVYFQQKKYDLALEWIQKIKKDQKRKAVFLKNIEAAIDVAK